jgi:hypothetical protein
MKQLSLIAALMVALIAANAVPAKARYYGRPVARATARVVLPPYAVVRPRVYAPRVYGYAPGYYGYGRGYYGYGLGYYGYTPGYYGYGIAWGY